MNLNCTECSAYGSAIWEISSLIQMARYHMTTVISDNLYKTFLHCDDYLLWAHRPDQVLHSTFILALEVKFKLALYQLNEGCDTDNIYDLPPVHKISAPVYEVTTTNKHSTDPSGSKGMQQHLCPHQPSQEEQDSQWHAPNHHGVWQGRHPTAPLDDKV